MREVASAYLAREGGDAGVDGDKPSPTQRGASTRGGRWPAYGHFKIFRAQITEHLHGHLPPVSRKETREADEPASAAVAISLSAARST